MSQQARIDVVSGVFGRLPRDLEFPKGSNGKQLVTSEIFGSNVFSLKEMGDRLPKPVFKTFCNQLKGGQTLDKITADAIAHAAKVWALERNATHFTHWFQPLNDTTAEKHDSFLSLKTTFANGLPEVSSIHISARRESVLINPMCTRLLPSRPSLDQSCCSQNLTLRPSHRVVCVRHSRPVVTLCGTPRGEFSCKQWGRHRVRARD